MDRDPEARAIFVLFDGARADVFRDLLAAGDLPHLARHVIEPGSLVTGTTVFPSVTMVAYIPFLFGRYPGKMGIPGLRWLDRGGAAGSSHDQNETTRSYCGIQASRLNGDIAPAEGMFSLVPESVAINTPITRGLRPGAHRVPFRRGMWGTISHFTGNYAPFDDAMIAAWHAAAREPWRFLFVVLSGIDGVTHHHDPFHVDVLEGYRRADRALGGFLARGAGQGPPPLIVVASDHGLLPVLRHWDLAEELERTGWPTIRHPVHLWRRNAKAAVMVSGNSCVHLYLEPRSGRGAPRRGAELPEELLGWLRAAPAVDLAAWRDDAGAIVVARGEATARVTEDQAGVKYSPLTGDPLGLGDRPLILDDRAMLTRSRATLYPDAPRQLLQLFAAARTGDVVLSAASDADFRGPWEIPAHRSGHGSLRKENMEIPIATSVRLGSGPVRSVDLMPLMLSHLGVPVPAGLDGVTP